MLLHFDALQTEKAVSEWIYAFENAQSRLLTLSSQIRPWRYCSGSSRFDLPTLRLKTEHAPDLFLFTPLQDFKNLILVWDMLIYRLSFWNWFRHTFWSSVDCNQLLVGLSDHWFKSTISTRLTVIFFRIKK